MKFRLIDTAPKDGTPLILCKYGWITDTRDMDIGSSEWCRRIFDDKAPRIYELFWITKGFWSEKWKNWNDGLEPSGLFKPTHWMEIDAMKIDSTSDDRTRNNVMRHEYRVLTDAEKDQMRQIKDIGLQLHNAIEAIGSSRELSLAKTKAEESVMWAVKHITG